MIINLNLHIEIKDGYVLDADDENYDGPILGNEAGAQLFDVEHVASHIADILRHQTKIDDTIGWRVIAASEARQIS